MDANIIKLAEKIYAQRVAEYAGTDMYKSGGGDKGYHTKVAECSIMAAQVFYEVKKGVMQ